MKTVKNRKNKRATILKSVIIALSVALLIASVFMLIREWEKDYGQFQQSVEVLDKDFTYNGKQYVYKDDLETILLLGLDKFSNEDSGYNNDKQADFLMLLAVDHSAKVCYPIQINRDSMVNMDVLGVAGDKIGTVKKQIALSHTYGNGREVSCRNAANAVSNMLLGVEIDHYVSVTMDAVSVYNDLVGGVAIEILDDFTGIDGTMVKGEVVKLTGEQALRYVRSRNGLDDSTNNNRMKRQKQYLEALYEKSRALSAVDESFIQKAALKVTDYIVSDCSINKLESIVNTISSYELSDIINFDGETVHGEEFMEFYPDEAMIKDVVVNCFYKEKA